MSNREHKPFKLNNPQMKRLNARLAARRQTKETLEQIAADFGISPQAAGYHAKKLPPAIRFKVIRKAVDDDEVLRLYGLHMNQSVVARELGVPLVTVSRALARMEWKAAA